MQVKTETQEMPQTQEMPDAEMPDASRGWWMFVLIGAASVVAGAILVAKPSDSLATLAVILGIFLVLDGIVELVESFAHTQENRALAASIGMLGVIVGIILIRHPTNAVTTIGLLIGIWLVAVGALQLVRSMATGEHLLLRAGIALLEIAVGVAIVSNPHIGYATLAVITGIWLIVSGFGTILLGAAIRANRSHFHSLR